MKRAVLTFATLLLAGLSLGASAQTKACEQDCATCLQEMTATLRERGWVGIEMDYDEEKGELSIVRVLADSPAQAAGLQPGDQLLALNGLSYTRENEEVLKKTYKSFRPGQTITYQVKRDGKKLDIEIHLAQLPERIVAQWIGQHMIRYHVDRDEQVADNE
jgi:C-terminal processing protease CtpA/Prc